MQVGPLSAIQKLAGVHSLRSDEQFLPSLELVGVSEVYDSQRSPTAGVVDDVFNYPLDVPMSFGEVQRPELGRSLPPLGVGLEDRPGTFTLCANYTSHFPMTETTRRLTWNINT